MILHTPVLFNEVIHIFSGVENSKIFVDATLGYGGHAEGMLMHFESSRLIGFDQDETARKLAGERLTRFGDRVEIVPENFRRLGVLTERDDWHGASGILFDLGVSNMQITDASRGFSFQENGPLDMRMDADSDAPNAADLVNNLDARELAKIFSSLGEERHAYQIAKSIVRRREKEGPIETTEDLVAVVRNTLPAPVQRKMGTHPARRIFQALRIAVNEELEVLDEGLDGAKNISCEGTIIVVISYHSLEDRLVKRRFKAWADLGEGKVLTRKVIVPTEEEIEENRRARSAKLRAFLFN